MTTILWADDEIDLLKPHILFLEERDYHVIPVTSGNEAIDELADKDIDIVFLDENMPGLSGLDTLTQIKNRYPSLPVIMITKPRRGTAATPRRPRGRDRRRRRRRSDRFLWCDDLSAYDSIVDFGAKVPLLGDHLSLFALLMAVVMWVYSKMTMANQAASNDPTASSMKFMTLWMMPIMMFFICNNLSAALSYYYLLSQLIAILQTWFIKKFMVHPEEILERLKATEGKPMPKSKWQQRLEEAQKLQEQQMRQQQKNRK